MECIEGDSRVLKNLVLVPTKPAAGQ